MTFPCPECGSTLWMRAVRIVEFGPGLFGRGIRERLVGFNCVCANMACATVVRVDGNGARRLGPARKETKGPQDVAPPEPPKKREPIEVNRTPTQRWTREARE